MTNDVGAEKPRLNALGMVGCSQLYCFYRLLCVLFGLGVALITCELSCVDEPYISHDLLTLLLLVQCS